MCRPRRPSRCRGRPSTAVPSSAEIAMSHEITGGELFSECSDARSGFGELVPARRGNRRPLKRGELRRQPSSHAPPTARDTPITLRTCSSTETNISAGQEKRNHAEQERSQLRLQSFKQAESALTMRAGVDEAQPNALVRREDELRQVALRLLVACSVA